MFNTYIKPMEPRTISHAFDSDQHIFQVKWDGVRILAFTGQNQVRLQNRKQKDRTLQYPEMQVLSRVIRAREVILDGEMIALKNGKPSFSRVLQRDLVTSTNHLGSALKISIIYMVFDILYCNGVNLTSLPWEIRDEKLKKVFTPIENIQITESIPQYGVKLYQAIQEQGLEGMVAKIRTSPYVMGGKTFYWQKVKPRKDINCVIGGYISDTAGLKSFLIGAYLEGRLKYLGRVGSGLSQPESKKLEKFLEHLDIEESPFSPVPKRQKNWHWVKPAVTIKVEFMEFTSDMQLRHPVIKGFTKINPKECTIEE